jgi:hypothetical protein
MSPLKFHKQAEEVYEGDGHYDELWPAAVLLAIPGDSIAEETYCSRD